MYFTELFIIIGFVVAIYLYRNYKFLNYRHFLNRKDLEMMGSSLKSLQQEAIKNLLILGNVNVIGHNVHRGR